MQQHTHYNIKAMTAQWFGLRVALWFLLVICYCRAAEPVSNSRTRSTSSASSSSFYPVQRIPTVPRDDAQRPPETHIAILRPHDSTNNNTNTNITNNGRTVYVLTTTDSFRVVAPPLPSLSSSAILQKPSHQWIDHQCLFAVNGGPFHRDGTCAGAVLLVEDDDNDNATVVRADDFGSVGLGRTKDDTMWIIGPVASEREAIVDLDLRYYVTGFDWLVYDGKVVASQFNNTTGADQAPRTAVGLTASGVLVIVVADGCQFWYVLVPHDTYCPGSIYPTPLTHHAPSFLSTAYTVVA